MFSLLGFFFLHFLVFPTPIPLFGSLFSFSSLSLSLSFLFSFSLSFFLRAKHKQNTVQAVGNSSQCSSWILSTGASRAHQQDPQETPCRIWWESWNRGRYALGALGLAGSTCWAQETGAEMQAQEVTEGGGGQVFPSGKPLNLLYLLPITYS